MDLEELLEVELRDLILVRDTEELRELGVRNDAALELGVLAVVGLDVVRDELRDLRLRALGARRDAEERTELIRDATLAEERVVRALRLPLRALLGGERGRVNTALLLRVAGLTLEGLDRRRGLRDRRARAGRNLRLDRADRLRERREDRLRRTDLRGRRGRRRGRGNRRDRHLGLGLGGGRLLGGGSRRGRGSRRGSGSRGSNLLGHLVCLNGGSNGGHFKRGYDSYLWRARKPLSSRNLSICRHDVKSNFRNLDLSSEQYITDPSCRPCKCFRRSMVSGCFQGITNPSGLNRSPSPQWRLQRPIAKNSLQGHQKLNHSCKPECVPVFGSQIIKPVLLQVLTQSYLLTSNHLGFRSMKYGNSISTSIVKDLPQSTTRVHIQRFLRLGICGGHCISHNLQKSLHVKSPDFTILLQAKLIDWV